MATAGPRGRPRGAKPATLFAPAVVANLGCRVAGRNLAVERRNHVVAGRVIGRRCDAGEYGDGIEHSRLGQRRIVGIRLHRLELRAFLYRQIRRDMSAAGPGQRMFVEPVDRVEHELSLGGADRIAFAIRNGEGMRVRPGRRLRVQHGDLHGVPVEQRAFLGEVDHRRHLPDAVDVHGRLARGEQRDRSRIFGIGRRPAVLGPLLHFGERRLRLAEIVAVEEFSVLQELSALLIKQRIENAPA